MKCKQLFIWVLLLFLNFELAKAQWNTGRFCSVLCNRNKCNQPAFDQCTECINGFTRKTPGASQSECIINTNSGYTLIGSSEDVDSGLFMTSTPAAVCGPHSVDWASDFSYDYYGNVSSTEPITFTGSISDAPHYQLRVIIWILLIDDEWESGDEFKVILTDDLGFNESKTIKRGTGIVKRKACGGNDNDYYIRFDQTFNHAKGNADLNIEIQANNSKPNAYWGAKELLLYGRNCHAACAECTSYLVTKCSVCNDGFKLSNTTCNETCLKGFGITAVDTECVFCNLRCTVCENDADNCSACTVTGTYKSFLRPGNACFADCEIGMYGNTSDRVCYDCNTTACVSCTGNPNYCFECQSGYKFANYICYDECPIKMFESNSSKNCTKCNDYCAECSINSTFCSVCVLTGPYKAYLNGSDCVRSCGVKYYESIEINALNVTENYCRACETSCYKCTGNPTPCSECNPENWLFENSCGQTCPTLYFADNATWHCLLCETWCVGLNMKMYFADATNDRIYVDLTFTEELDFNTFPYQTFQTFSINSGIYTLSMFHFSFQILSPKSYRVIMEPKGYLFLYNATISVETMTFPGQGSEHRSSNGRPFKEINYEIFKSLIWFLIKAPDMSTIEKSIINNFNNISDAVNNFTTLPYLQEIKKSGVFNLLLSGAQITSCSVLVNNIPSQNLYEGARFWATFVFFDVPAWEKNSYKTKYAIVPQVSEVVKNSRLLEGEPRTLFDINSIEWRFSRTGHTSFFIFDVYPALLLIVICWILVAIGHFLNKKSSQLFKKHMGKFFSLLHKAHEVSIMYIMLSTIMEWFYFDSSSVQRWVSLGICILVNIYMLIYQMYIYYDMIKYPVAVIGSEKYEYFVIRYGCFLKNIRYEEYDLKEPWSPKHWFRPYNYHILSFVKKVLMIISLPIFYNIVHAQASVLIILQLLEIARFCYVWPFYRKWRNIYRLILECALEMFFICILIQGFLVREIMENNEESLEWSIQLFYRFGWVGFGMVFLFNMGYVVLMIFDIFWGCKKTNKEMMDESRRIYYYGKLESYETEHHDVPVGMINKWVKMGNLNNRHYDDLPDVDVRFEYFKIMKVGDAYEIEIKILIDLFMSIEFNYGEVNNVDSERRINKRITLTPELSRNFYMLVDSLYNKYSVYKIEYIIIKTFLFVDQSLLKPGDKISLQRSKMSQTIEIQKSDDDKKLYKLNKVMDGFPLPISTLEIISG